MKRPRCVPKPSRISCDIALDGENVLRYGPLPKRYPGTAKTSKTEVKMIFTIYVTRRPNRTEEEKGDGEKLVFGPETFAAYSAEAALMMAGVKAGANIEFNSPLINVVVKPV
jgi:hypothetical protein